MVKKAKKPTKKKRNSSHKIISRELAEAFGFGGQSRRHRFDEYGNEIKKIKPLESK